ncbi:MAG: ArsR/SmtB family transcription factor [Salibacteraceae bacterium]
MGITKNSLFTEQQNEFSALAKALAHPARIAIIEHLLKSEVCINSHLVSELGLAQATISQHLKELKNAGLIQGSIDGTSMNYCINPLVWKKAKEQFNTLFDQHICCQGADCC